MPVGRPHAHPRASPRACQALRRAVRGLCGSLRLPHRPYHTWLRRHDRAAGWRVSARAHPVVPSARPVSVPAVSEPRGAVCFAKAHVPPKRTVLATALPARICAAFSSTCFVCVCFHVCVHFLVRVCFHDYVHFLACVAFSLSSLCASSSSSLWRPSRACGHVRAPAPRRSIGLAAAHRGACVRPAARCCLPGARRHKISSSSGGSSTRKKGTAERAQRTARSSEN